MDQMVLATQTWLNTTYNGVNGYTPFSEEELDGVTGNQTYKRLIQALQIELNTQYNAGMAKSIKSTIYQSFACHYSIN